MKRLISRNRICDFLQATAYILYSGWRNVHSMGWNVRSTAWNIRSSPWNIKFIRLLRETKAVCGINVFMNIDVRNLA